MGLRVQKRKIACKPQYQQRKTKRIVQAFLSTELQKLIIDRNGYNSD